MNNIVTIQSAEGPRAIVEHRALIALQPTNEHGTVVRTKVPAVRRWPLQPEFATLTGHSVTLVECHGY